MLTLVQDLRYGLRTLRNSPAFAVIAVFTLALGIGANVAIFSFVDGLWLHPMPVPHNEQLVRIFTSAPTSSGEIEQGLNSIPDFEDLRAATSLSGVALLERRGALYDDGSQNRLVSAAVVSNNFFDVLRPAPAWGRTFTGAELRSSTAFPIVISYPCWRRAFNSDPAIVGRSITLSRRSVVVLGVLPRSFRGTEALMVPDVWIPFATWLQQSPGDRYRQTERDFRDYEIFGRLREGVTLRQARAELSGIAARLAIAFPKTNSNRRFTAVFESDAHGEGPARLGLLLLGVAAIVLMIACANVAGLLIARGEYRRREIATRIALGGSRSRIIRQLLAESMILAVVGGAAAVLLGHWVLQVLPSLMPQSSMPIGVDAYISSRGLLVAAAAVVASLFLSTLSPALLATRVAPSSVLKSGIPQAGRARVLTRTALVTAQVALSLALAVCTGLLLLSWWNGLRMNPGFNAHQRMLVVDFSPGVKNGLGSEQLTNELRRRLEALPGVTGTAAALRVPFGMSGSGITHKVFTLQAPSSPDGITIHAAPVGDRYFEVLGTRILHGRAINRHDLETHARVVVVNQQMAARLWPDQDPVGRMVRLDKVNAEPYEVIGVAENGKYNEIQEDAMPYFFLPMGPEDYGEVEMAIRTVSDPAALAGSFRRNLRDLNPDAAIIELITLREHIHQALYIQSLSSRLIGAIGALGLVLAAVGIFGLMSFVVGHRRQEIGVRMALGSQRPAIFNLILRFALRLTAIGLLIGIPGALAAGYALRALLVGVAPANMAVFAVSVLVLLIAAFLAALLPAARAVHVDPITA
ncbi:MAG: ABC transporter permease, partial [Actinomycetota bacterium]